MQHTTQRNTHKPVKNHIGVLLRDEKTVQRLRRNTQFVRLFVHMECQSDNAKKE